MKTYEKNHGYVGLPMISRMPASPFKKHTHTHQLLSAICDFIPYFLSCFLGNVLTWRDSTNQRYGAFAGKEILLYLHYSTGLMIEPARKHAISYIIGSLIIVNYRNGW